jgi:hypothetical protein
MNAPTMCSRKGRDHATADPKGDRWIYIPNAPPVPGFDHWQGWWCRPCILDLLDMLQEHGLSHLIELPQ